MHRSSAKRPRTIVRVAVLYLPFGSLQSDISHLVTAEYLDFEVSPGRQEAGQRFPNSVGTRGYLTGSCNKHGLGLEETDQSVKVKLLALSAWQICCVLV